MKHRLLCRYDGFWRVWRVWKGRYGKFGKSTGVILSDHVKTGEF